MHNPVNMKKFLISISIATFSVFLISGCATISSLASLANCEYRMQSITKTQLAGIDIQNASGLKSLNLLSVGKLTRAYLEEDLPLNFQLNVEARNPNSQTASLNEFDWILLIDDIEMVRGSHQKAVNIPANDGTIIIPLDISFNLFDALRNESKDALLNFAFNLADASNTPTRVDLKIKPTVYINQVPLTYPDYFKVGTSFGDESL